MFSYFAWRLAFLPYHRLKSAFNWISKFSITILKSRQIDSHFSTISQLTESNFSCKKIASLVKAWISALFSTYSYSKNAYDYLVYALNVSSVSTIMSIFMFNFVISTSSKDTSDASGSSSFTILFGGTAASIFCWRELQLTSSTSNCLFA